MMANKYNSKITKFDRYFLIKVLKYMDGKLSKLDAEEFRNHVELLILDKEMNARTEAGDNELNKI